MTRGYFFFGATAFIFFLATVGSVLANEKPCGQSASLGPTSVEERIRDCSLTKTIKVGNQSYTWRLVVRSFRPVAGSSATIVGGVEEESWRDEKTGIIWHRPGNDIRLTYWTSQDWCEEDATIEGTSFRLPSIRAYARAESHGLRQVFKHLGGTWFWSHTDREGTPHRYHGSTGETSVGEPDREHTLFCVGKPGR